MVAGIWKKSAFVPNINVPKGSAARYQYNNANSDKCSSLFAGVIYGLNICTDKIQSGKGTKYYFNESDSTQLVQASYNGDTTCSNVQTSVKTLGYLTCTEGDAPTQHFKVVKGTYEPPVSSGPYVNLGSTTVILVSFLAMTMF